MSTDTLLIGGLIVIGFSCLYWLLVKKLEQPKDNTVTEWLKSMQGTLQRGYGDLYQRLDKATDVIGELKREAGAITELGRSMRGLEDFLKSPKLRGNIAERVLNDLIAQMFPKNSFFIQHAFKSGNIVDAAIKTDAGILPIDSKFPMENFQKMVKAEKESEKLFYRRALEHDVRRHIKDISGKYILPDEGTMDFALMYVPSESIYYEIANMEDVLEYARQLRVYPVSPTTLYAHLQTILLSFEGHKIETKTKEVFGIIRSIQKDYEKLDENLGVLNKHLTNAYNQMNNTTQTMATLGQKLTSARSLKSGEEET